MTPYNSGLSPVRRDLRRGLSTALLAGLIVAGLSIFAPAADAATVPGDFSTIQAAISAVVGGSLPDGTVINVQPGTYSETLLINSTAKSMTIRATGSAGSAVVDAAGKNLTAIRILGATGTIRIDGLKFRNGMGESTGGNGGGFTILNSSPTFVNCTFENNTTPASGGAGVMTTANPVFDNCVFQNNTARQFGGAFAITVGSRPVFSNSIIQNNTSGTGSNIGSGGAAHVNDASPTFQACSIINNHSAFGGGGIVVIGIFGSAFGESTLTIDDSDVSGNTAVRFSPSDLPAEGGGIHVENNTVGVIRRSTIRNNTANTGGGLSGYRARYVIESSIIEGNTAADPAAVGGFGGGVESSSSNVSTPLQRSASISLTDTVVRNNTARIGAGVFIGGDLACGGGTCTDANATKATLQITGSVIDKNIASLQAGGVFTSRTNLTMTDSLVSRNQANGGVGGFGGGFAIVSGTVATLTNARIAGNSATGFGGGLYHDINTTLTGSLLSIHNNTAPGTGGGGGLFVGGQGTNTGSIADSAFVDNTPGTDIVEQCPGSSPFLTYTNIKFATNGTVYNGVCTPPGTALNPAAFEALNKTSGTGAVGLADVQARAFFKAVPPNSPTALWWDVIRATSVTITPGVGTFTTNPQTGTADVAVTSTTTYTLNAATGFGALNPALTTTLLGAPVQFGAPGDVPVPADYDGDGKTDFAVYRPATGEWFVFGTRSGFRTLVFGSPSVLGLGDTPVPADYDGDGIADLAVYRKATGEWFVFGSRSGFRTLVFGSPAAAGLNDFPAPADFDGDGIADLAVYRQATGEWFVFGTRSGFRTLVFGSPAVLGLGDTPVQADYDGDGLADLAVYRKATGEWFVFGTRTGFRTLLFGSPAASGLGDIPVPGDYDGDGSADLAIRRSADGNWFIFQSRDGFRQQLWGSPTDIPAPGDYDGNHRTDITVWRPSNGAWLILP
ncbi:MAG TPA: FG-GAP-like repeat-containing protein [Candidatus Acidoferrum sp.]|nr:FG-GAP-like repeat-containing protein [Candidatus Acidoferrum sp.]